MADQPIRVLDLAGSSTEVGRAHGTAYAAEIREYTEERVRLSSDGVWAGHVVTRDEVIALAEACLPAHEAYDPELYAEMLVMAEAAGISPAEAVIVGGFTDFIDTVRAAGGDPAPEDSCTAALVPPDAGGGEPWFAQTWDMHDTATPYIVMLRTRVTGRPEALVFTTVGCLGQIGMNDAGLCVGINNLTAADGKVGVTWPFVVRKALAQTSIDDALACITGADLAGGHNFLLLDAEGRGYDVEAMPTATHVIELHDEPVVHTNHCVAEITQAVEGPRAPVRIASSERRYARAVELVGKRPIDEQSLMALTRDEDAICERPEPPYHVMSCGATVMRPVTRELWAVWGLPVENQYEHFTVGNG
ncbi:MAG: C45 family peptidase [Acidimicrobiales bacterium]